MSATAAEKVSDIFLLLSFFKLKKIKKIKKIFFTLFSFFILSFYLYVPIIPLIFIFITYYYLAKKDPIFKTNFIYTYFIISLTLFFVCFFTGLVVWFFFLFLSFFF